MAGWDNPTVESLSRFFTTHVLSSFRCREVRSGIRTNARIVFRFATIGHSSLKTCPFRCQDVISLLTPSDTASPSAFFRKRNRISAVNTQSPPLNSNTPPPRRQNQGRPAAAATPWVLVRCRTEHAHRRLHDSQAFQVTQGGPHVPARPDGPQRTRFGCQSLHDSRSRLDRHDPWGVDQLSVSLECEQQTSDRQTSFGRRGAACRQAESHRDHMHATARPQVGSRRKRSMYALYPSFIGRSRSRRIRRRIVVTGSPVTGFSACFS